MDIKKHFTFKGRISRMTYFGYQVFAGIPIFFIQLLILFRQPKPWLVFVLTVLIIPFSIVLLCKSIQRLHDIGLPGTIIIIPYAINLLNLFTPTYNFFPFVAIFYIVLMLVKGNQDSNKYGEEPLE